MTAQYTWQPFWLLPLAVCISFAAGVLLLNAIRKRRERKIFLGLQNIIDAEKEIREIRVYSQAKDAEDALKELFETRKAEIEQMKKLETYRRDYIGNVAHELKTPIFTIQGYLDTISDELNEDKPDFEIVQNFLSKSIKNTERLNQIISDLDTITKYESGNLQLNYESFDLNELVREVIESLELQARDRGIFMSLSAIPNTYLVYADKFRIRQVLTNLCFNSVKYGKQGGYTKVRLTNTGEKVIVEIADNGIGIPAQHLKRIFERFYRVDSHRSRETGGSGLGLSICKHIIEAHGEQISVLSTEGAGSVFSFSLKLADD